MIPFLTALTVAFVATGVSISPLRRARVLDVPNERSSHQSVTPRGGGVGVLAGVTVAIAVSEPDRTTLVILATALLAGLLGLVDDVAGLRAGPRLGIQTLLAAGLATWLVHDQTDQIWILVGGIVVAAVWLVGYVNAFNFMDGVNGISALNSALAGGWYAWLGLYLDRPAISVAGLALLGASLGFLPWNAPRARVFLGDVGSYGIGMLIGALSVFALVAGANPVLAVAPLTVYLADTTWTLIKRISRGDALAEAHRQHVYQRLVDEGWSHLGAAALVAGTGLLVALAAGLLPAVLAVGCAAVLLVAYLVLPTAVRHRHGIST